MAASASRRTIRAGQQVLSLVLLSAFLLSGWRCHLALLQQATKHAPTPVSHYDRISNDVVEGKAEQYLFECNRQCNEFQRCFLGRCYCLPGRGGVDCSERKIYHKLNASACPSPYSSMDQVQSQPSFSIPKSSCRLSPWASDPRSCAVFCNWQEDAGIVSVSPTIWEGVTDNEFAHHQNYKVVQDTSQIPEGQTRWREYTQGFSRFEALPNKTSLGRYLEVGPGLYTQLYNLMTVRPDIQPSSIYLVEPNIFRYLSMPQCLYGDGKLLGHRAHLLSVTTEELPMHNFFDTVLVINVLEHVLDGFDFLTQIYRALRPGGLLIFAERYFDDPDDPSTKVLGSGLLHPIRLNHRTIQHFFRLFDKIYVKDFSTDESNRRGLGEQGYYFIGEKK